MMHGHEKSDSVIVAVKPANKAVHPAAEQSAAEPAAAESVERRAETKGNADQQSTCRTQSPISVSQALDACGKQLPFGPEVGAVCGKAARTDLRGGRSAMDVPTASLQYCCNAYVAYWQILLQKSLMASANSDSVAVTMRIAAEARNDGAAQSRPRAAILFILS